MALGKQDEKEIKHYIGFYNSEVASVLGNCNSADVTHSALSVSILYEAVWQVSVIGSSPLVPVG
jgi:hypothetical protein